MSDRLDSFKARVTSLKQDIAAHPKGDYVAKLTELLEEVQMEIIYFEEDEGAMALAFELVNMAYADCVFCHTSLSLVQQTKWDLQDAEARVKNAQRWWNIKEKYKRGECACDLMNDGEPCDLCEKKAVTAPAAAKKS